MQLIDLSTVDSSVVKADLRVYDSNPSGVSYVSIFDCICKGLTFAHWQTYLTLLWNHWIDSCLFMRQKPKFDLGGGTHLNKLLSVAIKNWSLT